MSTTQSSVRGVGIGLRREHFGMIESCERPLDWLEIIPENFVGVGGAARRTLDRCRERFGVLAHGVSMSLGGPDPLPTDYIAQLRRLLDDLDAPFYTDHLCYATIGGTNFYDLLPLPFTDEAVLHCAKRIRRLADQLERPVAVENISYYAVMPGAELSHAEFVSAVAEEADCGLLLDVNNVYVNARNHEEDPLAILDALPLARTMQMHLAGHIVQAGRVIDNHGRPLIDAVWDLYRQALARVGPVPTLLEWDTDIPSLDRVLDEADKARAIFAEFDTAGASA